MKSISKILNEIKQLASLNVSLFVMENFLAENPSFSADFSANDSGILRDGNNTYFTVEINSTLYLAKIEGEQPISVAVLVKQLILSVEIDDFDNLSFESKMRKLLLGELSQMRCVAVKNSIKRLSFFSLGLIVDNRAKQTELENFIDTFKSKDDIFIKVDDTFVMYYRKASSEYNNAEDFANILYQNVKEELRINLKIAVVGKISCFEELASSYEKAVETSELGKIFFPFANIWTYRNFALNKILLKSDKKLLKETLDSIVKKGSESVWDDIELMTTADAFISNSLNISETSRVLYVHRNTLMYRLDKIERETGYNLRNFADAVVFNLITIIRTILQSN